MHEWVNGESFLYLGRTYRLSLIAHQARPLQLKEGRFCLRSDVIEKGGTAAAKKAFAAYLTQKGESKLRDRIDYYAPQVGVEISAFKIKDMGYRWASCGVNGNLNFHWECLMAPLKIIDYIVVHELCHLHIGNHNQAFWNEVDKVLPDYRERKEWLKQHGASFTI